MLLLLANLAKNIGILTKVLYNCSGKLLYQRVIHGIAAGDGAEIVFFIQFKGNAAPRRIDVKRNCIALYVWGNLVKLAVDGNGKRVHKAKIGKNKKRRPGKPGLPTIKAPAGA